MTLNLGVNLYVRNIKYFSSDLDLTWFRSTWNLFYSNSTELNINPSSIIWSICLRLHSSLHLFSLVSEGFLHSCICLTISSKVTEPDCVERRFLGTLVKCEPPETLGIEANLSSRIPGKPISLFPITFPCPFLPISSTLPPSLCSGCEVLLSSVLPLFISFGFPIAC